MATPLRRLSQFVNVGANSIATLSLNELSGHSVHAIVLQMGGTTFTKSQVTDITLTVGGKPIIPGISGNQLQDLNDYEGFSSDANFLTIWFGDPTLEGVAAGHVGDLDLSYYDRVASVLEVSISNATAPTLQAWAMVGPPKSLMNFDFSQRDVANHRALIRSILSPAAAVTKQSYPVSVGSQAGARIRKIALFHSNVVSVEFKKNAIAIHDDVPDSLNDYVQSEFGRAPQSGLYVLDHVVDGALGKADATVNANGNPFSTQFNLTTSAADTVTAIADVMVPLQLI